MKTNLILALTFGALSAVAIGCSSSNGNGTPGGDTGDAGSVNRDAGNASTDSGATPGNEDAGKTSTDAGPTSGPFACSANGGGCTCIVTDTGTSVAGSCPAATMPQPQCCAGSNYPSADISECTCENYACTNLGGGICQCGLDSSGTAQGAACTGTYLHCCMDTITNLSCTCSAATCQTGSQEVTSCSVAALQCGPGTAPVSSCR